MGKKHKNKGVVVVDKNHRIPLSSILQAGSTPRLYCKYFIIPKDDHFFNYLFNTDQNLSQIVVNCKGSC